VSAEFGPYKLLTMLGKGGMGEVWRAHDTDTDRVVALKVLPTTLADDDLYRERFLREAQIVSRLNNPFVVPIHRYGTIDGRLYVDMRLVEGRDLATLLAYGPLAPPRAVAIVEQAAKALNAAHKLGLVHRDVKPSNVLVTDDDFAYLIDFGIAQDVNRTGLTGTGTVIGTWSYMAPERMTTAGSSAPSCDIYSLACVLHECLTATKPFPGDSVEMQVAAHLQAPPPRPSMMAPNVSPDFDVVVDRGMAKDPRARYGTTLELAQAARSALDGTAAAPTQWAAPPTWPAPQVQPQTWAARPVPAPPPPPAAGGRRKLIVGIVAALAVLVGGVVAAVLLLAGGNGDPAGTAASPSTASPSQATESSAVSTAAPGAPVTVGDLQVTVTGTETVTDLQGMTPVNGEFFIVHLTVRNQGSSTATHLASLQHLIAGDMSYQGSAGAAVHLENGFMPSIPPGDQVRTAFAFDVPPNVDPTAIDIDNDLLPGGGVRVPLR
jgi:predicted Ser/Thr protein kinase